MDKITQDSSVVEKPVEVTHAVRLIYGAVGIGIINTITDFPYLSSLVPPKLLIFQMAFTYAIIIFLAFKISQGRNWARIIFLIVFVFGLPASLPSFMSHFSRSSLAGWLMLLTTLVQLTANVLLFQKPSNVWFKSIKLSRMEYEGET